MSKWATHHHSARFCLTGRS